MKETDILIVDDEEFILDILGQVLKNAGYTFITANNGKEALEKLKKNKVKLVISDIVMTPKDGMELLTDIQKQFPDTAVIMLTGYADIQKAVNAMKDGAYDFFEKPISDFDKLILSIERALEKRELLIEVKKYRKELEKQVEEKTQALRKNYLATLDVLISTLGFHDPETGGHCYRVAEYSRLIAQRMGLSEEKIVHIERGALLHDIGKVSISDTVLNKPGPLTDEEWIEMKKHPSVGYELLKKHSFLEKAAYIALYHHERYDGSGYPEGLAKDNIPIEARVFALVDAFDVITSDRTYTKAKSIKEAREELDRCAGTHFDPKIVGIFNNEITDEEIIKVRERVEEMINEKKSRNSVSSANIDTVT